VSRQLKASVSRKAQLEGFPKPARPNRNPVSTPPPIETIQSDTPMNNIRKLWILLMKTRMISQLYLLRTDDYTLVLRDSLRFHLWATARLLQAFMEMCTNDSDRSQLNGISIITCATFLSFVFSLLCIHKSFLKQIWNSCWKHFDECYATHGIYRDSLY